MEHRTMIINVISAKDLHKVNFITKMNVYAVVHISGGGSSKKSKQKTKTHVDKDGGSNPTWNFPMKFNIDESAAHQNRLTLVFNLKSDRVLGDKDIGEVHVPIIELMQYVVEGYNGHKQNHFVTYQVRKPNGQPKGQLSISYTFGDKVTRPAIAPPCMSAVNHTGSSSVYTPPPSGYGHRVEPSAVGYNAYPPPAYHQSGPSAPVGYGYPPPPPPAYNGYPPSSPLGHGYPPQPQPHKKNRLGGLGLGAGLLGGAIGGLLIGDMVSDGFDF